MSRGAKIGLALTAVAVAVVAGGSAMRSRKDQGTEVIVAKVERQDIVAKVTANGKIQAEKKVDLSALVMGQIVNLVVAEGDHVKTGDLLLQIDQNRAAAEEAGASAALRSTRADLESSRSSLQQAERDLERAKKNFEAEILPIAEYQRARSTVETTRASFQSLQSRVDQFKATLTASRDTLSKTTVLAPVDGVITALRVKAGEVTVLGTMNNPGTQLMTISDMASVQAVLMVDETDMPNVVLGQKAILSLDSYPGRTFEGVVTEAGQSPIARDDADLQGLTTTSDAINFKVRVKVSDPPPAIRPGFSVTADIITGTTVKAQAVPLAAVVIRDSPAGDKTAAGKLKTEEGIYRFQAGKAVFVPIETGLAGDLMVEVRRGLEDGQEVITGPFKALREIKDGGAVRIMPEKKKKALEDEKPGATS